MLKLIQDLECHIPLEDGLRCVFMALVYHWKPSFIPRFIFS